MNAFTSRIASPFLQTLLQSPRSVRRPLVELLTPLPPRVEQADLLAAFAIRGPVITEPQLEETVLTIDDPRVREPQSHTVLGQQISPPLKRRQRRGLAGASERGQVLSDRAPSMILVKDYSAH